LKIGRFKLVRRRGLVGRVRLRIETIGLIEVN
jgi:hypothetical protein